MSSQPAPHLRLALVLNGGVSLAVWIGGVVHEIDRLRRARDSPQDEDTKGYLEALEGVESVRVDVIAGASAGGINGALLGAAIQGTGEEGSKPLRSADGLPLRDVWLEIGDLQELTRSIREKDPPSLLKGDEYFRPLLEEVLGGLLVQESKLSHPLYVYLTATDVRGTRNVSFATSDGTIVEPDHRVVFRFSAGKGALDDPSTYDPPDPTDMGETLPLDASQVKRVARAARATSSFPAAFPTHEAVIRRPEDGYAGLRPTFLADGGILDNQPFDPVLDRISVMPVEERWRRVVLYVVPYVAEQKAEDDGEGNTTPGLAEVIGSSGLARDLAKINGLEDVERARSQAAAAAEADAAFHTSLESVTPAARELYPTYRRVQLAELRQTALQWQASPRSVGTGFEGQDERRLTAQAHRPIGQAMADELEPDQVARLDRLLPPDIPWADLTEGGWMPADASWCWGLSKAERFTRVALFWLRAREQEVADAAAISGEIRAARQKASALKSAVRTAMAARRAAFYDRDERATDALEAFVASHDDIETELETVRTALDGFLGAVAIASDTDRRTIFERLISVEVVSNAAGVRPQAPPSFDFYRVSAQPPAGDDAPPPEGPAIDHPSTTPEEKLAGMQLGHFAAFLKRSWRANDWMWGRLDGIAWLGRALFPPDETESSAGSQERKRRRETWVRDRQLEVLREELPKLAEAVDYDEGERFSARADLSVWRRAQSQLLAGLKDADPADVIEVFNACQLSSGADRVAKEAASPAGMVTATRLAAVASRAFSGARSGLPRPIRRLVATTRGLTRLASAVAAIRARTRRSGKR